MAYRSVGTGSTGTGTSTSVGLPAGMQVGDTVVIALYLENTDTITWPTGFTLGPERNTSATTQGRIVTAWKTLTVAGDATDEGDNDYDISWTNSSKFTAVAIAGSGRLHIGTPYDSNATASSGSGTATTIAGTLTTVVDGDDIIVIGSNHATNAGAWGTAPTGMTKRYDPNLSAAGTGNMVVYTQDNAGAAGGYAKTVTSVGVTGSSNPKIIMIGFSPDRATWRDVAATAGNVTNTAFAITLPTHEAGDRLVVAVGGKYDGVSQPTLSAGWACTRFDKGGTGAQGINTGPTFLAIFEKTAASNAESNPTVTYGGGTAPAIWTAQAYSFVPALGKVWRDSIQASAPYSAAAYDTDHTSSTMSATTSALTNQPEPGDIIFAVQCGPSSAGANVAPSAISATGVSNGVLRTIRYSELSTSPGVMMGAFDLEGYTGTASSGITSTAAYAGSSQSGVVVNMALRQSDPVSQKSYWGIRAAA